MEQQTVRLSVPAEAAFARSVRMMASNLAVVAQMSVDNVEDVRMAAEEAFVFACATRPVQCDIVFGMSSEGMTMDFRLGESTDDEEDEELMESLDLAELLLSAVCDEYEISDDGTELHVVKRMAGQDAR